jgi:hypothetical protein
MYQHDINTPCIYISEISRASRDIKNAYNQIILSKKMIAMPKQSSTRRSTNMFHIDRHNQKGCTLGFHPRVRLRQHIDRVRLISLGMCHWEISRGHDRTVMYVVPYECARWDGSWDLAFMLTTFPAASNGIGVGHLKHEMGTCYPDLALTYIISPKNHTTSTQPRMDLWHHKGKG